MVGISAKITVKGLAVSGYLWDSDDRNAYGYFNRGNRFGKGGRGRATGHAPTLSRTKATLRPGAKVQGVDPQMAADLGGATL